MISSHIILAASWIVFCILHSVFAAPAFKRSVQIAMGRYKRYYRFVYTIIAFITFAFVMIYLFTLPSPLLFVANTFITIAGVAISTIGFVVMAICITKYFMQLSGIKGLVQSGQANELMITGIHKHVRHPLYSGTFVFIWGLLLLYPHWSLLIVNLIITIYTLMGIRFEEQKLIAEFGEKYREYRRKVPMLIPGMDRRDAKARS